MLTSSTTQRHLGLGEGRGGQALAGSCKVSSFWRAFCVVAADVCPAVVGPARRSRLSRIARTAIPLTIGSATDTPENGGVRGRLSLFRDLPGAPV